MYEYDVEEQQHVVNVRVDGNSFLDMQKQLRRK